MSRRLALTCEIDIEQSFDSFHAHAIPDGAEIAPGDIVIVHDAPSGIDFGERYAGTRPATLIRANPLRRLFTRLAGVFAIAELYEVGFQPVSERPRP